MRPATPYHGWMLSSGEVLIVSGPPGSGKTSVSAALASGCERGVHLESDWFYRSIRSGFIAPWLPDAHTQNEAVMMVAADAAAAYADAGYVVVWDGIVGPWFLDRVVRRLGARKIRVQYLVLRPKRVTALQRVRGRDDTPETTGAAAMYDQFADLGEFEPHVVSSDAPAAQVIEECRAALVDGRLEVELDSWADDRWPVSVKAVLGWHDQVVVLRNRRGEWELPGGRLDSTDDSPQDALRREIGEELGLSAVVGSMIDSWIYDVDGKRVLILTYACTASRPALLSHSAEHTEVGVLSTAELANAAIPSGYLQSINSMFDQQR